MDKLTRRQFLGSLIVGATCSGLIYSSFKKSNTANSQVFSIKGQDAEFLHRIRDHNLNLDQAERLDGSFDCVVLGGGISGLSSLYHLEKLFEGTYLGLEAQSEVGGNSQFGENDISRYPWGAHYLPLPDSGLSDLIEFLIGLNVAKREGLPSRINYNPEYLIHHPETKLLYRGKWYDGIVPHENLSNLEKDEYKKFTQLINRFKNLIGSDGKKAFALPILNSSRDHELLELDKLSFKEYLDINNLKSDFIRWYTNYATKDDYGHDYDEVSAWAGIHYFASRAHGEEDSKESGLLTWPEGNGFLVKGFKDKIKSEIKNNCLILKVLANKNLGYQVFYLDRKDSKIKKLQVKSVISALPHFVNQRIFSEGFGLPSLDLNYSPWLVANLSIPNLPSDYRNIPWDSVSYHSESLGFVRADHQLMAPKNMGTVLTYYFSFSKGEGSKHRHGLLTSDIEELGKEVLIELGKFYPGLQRSVRNIDFWIWGHAMSCPKPGTMERIINSEKNSIHSKVFLAHTDYSGISIFEEAFYQGLRAAKETMKVI